MVPDIHVHAKFHNEPFIMRRAIWQHVRRHTNSHTRTHARTLTIPVQIASSSEQVLLTSTEYLQLFVRMSSCPGSLTSLWRCVRRGSCGFQHSVYRGRFRGSMTPTLGLQHMVGKYYSWASCLGRIFLSYSNTMGTLLSHFVYLLKRWVFRCNPNQWCIGCMHDNMWPICTKPVTCRRKHKLSFSYVQKEEKMGFNLVQKTFICDN